MPDDDKPQGAGGDDGSKGKKGDGDGSGGTEPTAAQLQGIMTAQLGSIKNDLKSTMAELQKTAQGNAEGLKELAAVVASLANAKESGDGSQGTVSGTVDRDGHGGSGGRSGGDPKDNAQVLKLSKELEKMQKRLDEAEKKAIDAETAKERADFERSIKDCLRDAGCKKPDAAYKVIADMPQRDDESGAIVVPYKHPEHGEMTLELERFVEDIVRPELLPELFGSRAKGGPDAAGSHGSRGGKSEYDISYEQYTDPNWLAKPGNMDKLFEAERAGRVEPAPEGDSFSIRGGAPRRRRRV